MVIVLGNQLGHLGDGIIVSFLGGDKLRNEGNLSPQNETGLVAQIVEILIMLIVGQTDGIGAHLFDQRHILLMISLGDGPALVQTVLVTGHTMQRHILAVKPEAGIGINMEAAVAIGHANSVQDLFLIHHGSLAGIAAGIGNAVPQMRLFHINKNMGMTGSLSLSDAHHIALSILQLHLQGAAFRIDREQINAGLAYIVRRYKHSIGAVHQQIKVSILNLDEVHITIKTAVESKVSILGIHVALCIGDHHGQHIAFGQKGIGQFVTERGEAALMGSQFSAVAVNGSHMVGALELDVLLLALGGIGQVDLVGADAAPVVTAAVLAIESIPGVGQRHRSKGLAFLGKQRRGQKSFYTHEYVLLSNGKVMVNNNLIVSHPMLPVK